MICKFSFLFACLTALCSLTSLVEAKADVHEDVFRQIAEHPDQGILITFDSAHVEHAYDAKEIYNFAKTGGVKCALSATHSAGEEEEEKEVEDFTATPCYSEARGQYVYTRLHHHHDLTLDWIKEKYPNVQILSSIPISNSFLVVATAEDVLKMTEDRHVLEIHTNEMFRVPLPNEPDSGVEQPPSVMPKNIRRFLALRNGEPEWNIRRVGAPAVWEMAGNHTRGEGIVYAVADTGVEYTHPNIAKNYLGRQADGTYDHNYAWFDGVRKRLMVGNGQCGIASPVPCDDQGHGTHVLSTAVGANGYGVAPGAKWMACRNMDRGLGSPTTYLNCLNFFLAPHDLEGNNPDPSRRPHVVGNSYGCPTSEGCSKRAMASAVDALRAAGVFMAVSAGNEGPGCGTIADPPALEKSVISVAAVDEFDNLANFSSRGPVTVDGETYRKPNLAAPGVRIHAAYPGKGYKSLNGTSMASPHVSGAAILIMSMCPCLERDVDRIQALLESTAIRLLPPKESGDNLCGGDRPDSIPNNYFGWGRINILAAVKQCRRICSISAPSSFDE